jgi:hypothetical protein
MFRTLNTKLIALLAMTENFSIERVLLLLMMRLLLLMQLLPVDL